MSDGELIAVGMLLFALAFLIAAILYDQDQGC